MSRYVSSKWRKTVALLQGQRLKPMIPVTVRFNRSQLEKMLKRYGMVYVKPDIGSHGRGVMRAELSKGQYRYQLGVKPRTHRSYDEMYEAMRKEIKGRRYLVQKGIRLLTHKGHRFDLRVMVQRNPYKIWETTGIIGRVAAPRKIVTNYHNGGTLMTANRLLSSHMGKSAVRKKVASLEQMGIRAGQAMSTRFPGVCEIGVDVGIDQSLKPWIIEVNTAPDPFIFRKLPDPSVFRKIRRYENANDRVKP